MQGGTTFNAGLLSTIWLVKNCTLNGEKIEILQVRHIEYTNLSRYVYVHTSIHFWFKTERRILKLL